MIHLENLARLEAEDLRALERVVQKHATLVDALEYSAQCGNVRSFPLVVIQDEYSHDVVFPWREGCVLVYGTT